MIRVVLILFIFFSNFAFADEENKTEFSAIAVHFNGKVAIVRFEKNSGDTWYRKNGKFKMILDKNVLPQGKYRIESMSLSNGWGLLRINEETGETWVTESYGWQKIEDE